jgi:hypothetical protein
MVESKGKHYYIMEPLQLKDLEIVIPIFFYTQTDGVLLAKCCTPTLKCNVDHSKITIYFSPTASFDHPDLKTVAVDHFSLIYNDIHLNNGLKFSDCCGNRMLGEKRKT